MTSRFEAFWPEYLKLHAQARTRRAHACATASAGALLLAAALWRNPWLLLAAPAVDYGIAQLSHRRFERNVTRPWLHPVLHLRAELKLFALTVTGRMDVELRRQASTP